MFHFTTKEFLSYLLKSCLPLQSKMVRFRSWKPVLKKIITGLKYKTYSRNYNESINFDYYLIKSWCRKSTLLDYFVQLLMPRQQKKMDTARTTPDCYYMTPIGSGVLACILRYLASKNKENWPTLLNWIEFCCYWWKPICSLKLLYLYKLNRQPRLLFGKTFQCYKISGKIYRGWQVLSSGISFSVTLLVYAPSA